MRLWSFRRRGCLSFPPPAAVSGSATRRCFWFRHLPSSPLVNHPPSLPLAYRLWCWVVSFLVIEMAGAVIPKIDDALDTGNNTKSENLPVHVTSIRLNKDNYLSWSAALEIGITSRGRLHYITGEKPAPSKTDPQWATWALEDSQVKVWIISFVSADIQPLILRKLTAYDMWTVLARMYGSKKRVLHHALYWEKEWMDRTFIFLGGLRDEFESIRSQLLNCDEIPGIEEQPLLAVLQGQGNVLLNGAAIATNWVILLTIVGIFILRSDLSGVVLLLVGELLLCPSLVRVPHPMLSNPSSPQSTQRAASIH
ncbi:hypothetical protein EJ110_NYTH60217 [Nymphaea thermarum]|nr:hypothetical protein EJ110_NYTH60217 [Nymphaea thermarum]